MHERLQQASVLDFDCHQHATFIVQQMSQIFDLLKITKINRRKFTHFKS